MRKISVFMMVSLDGYYARPNGDLDWHVVDSEFNQFAQAQLSEMDTLVFGRITYELMERYWQTKEAIDRDPAVAGFMHALPKIVFSKTLPSVSWHNARLFHTVNAAEIRTWKQQPGRDMLILGSGTIVQQLTNFQLLDEYRLMVNPVILGQGKSFFTDIALKPSLTLRKATAFNSGNVLLTYRLNSK